MIDCPSEPLRPQFDRRLRLRFFGVKVTSDAGGAHDLEVEPRRTGMVRREVGSNVEDQAARGPSTCPIGHRLSRMLQSRRLTCWTRASGLVLMRVPEAGTARSTAHPGISGSRTCGHFDSEPVLRLLA